MAPPAPFRRVSTSAKVFTSFGMTAFLTVLEAIYLIVPGKWNSEIFAVITGLVGNITGIFLSQKT
ncbi:hypothetical protein KEJ37_04495 [Candidatus Bathyarchaeota archaeon]|nr:hypothetical protein [Candidatus Bathyarchaeota archaeon]